MAKPGKKKTSGSSLESPGNFQFPESIRTLNSFPQLLYKPKFESIIPNQIFKVDKFLTSSQCQDLISSVEKNLPLETTPLVKSKFYAARVNDRTSVSDPAIAQVVFEFFKKLLQTNSDNGRLEEWISSDMEDSVGCNPNLRIYRYTKGHYFGKHYDESVNISPGKTTKWTVLIYLSGEQLSGGKTIFYTMEKGKNSSVAVQPETGMALFHKHGDDCLLHEAEEVKSGEKWVFRTDVVF